MARIQALYDAIVNGDARASVALASLYDAIVNGDARASVALARNLVLGQA